MLNASKSELHKLVDALPEQEAIIAKRFMQFLLSKLDEPMLQAFLNATEDDEPVTEGELKAISEAEDDVSHGRMRSLDDVVREFGYEG